ncbi:MAG: SPOR domain-containing protein [Paludibacteraceae bacterium]|nr:SPOR domain-containing protein [Paludibacteraceae bacterium]MDY6427088.1 SPOR domain-containing protein [Bacteroidales bacterium]
MQELIHNIEILLASHNFIVVPGFGGFVAEKESAMECDSTFYPAHKAIGFNPSLTYNDGLIAQQYALTKLISFEEANRQIDRAVGELITMLTTWGHLKLGNIGMFHYIDGNIIFEPAVNNFFLSSSYGLVPVYFPKIHQLAAAQEQESGIVAEEAPVKAETADAGRSHGIRFTPSRNWIAAAVAAVLLIILFPLHVNDSKTDFAAGADKASFARAVEVITNNAEPADTASTAMPEASNAKYHIIIGSFYSQAKALKYIAELPAQYRENCTIIFSEHRYRVSYRAFSNEAESDEFLETFSDNPRFRDAWILEVADNNNENTTIL